MKELIFATNNENKVREMRSLIPSDYSVLSLKESGIDIEIPEPYNTLEANASEKSLVIMNLTQKDCFSEDTGLEVEALNGRPGVLSARYAGEKRNFRDNILKVLNELGQHSNRSAQFRTIISLRLNKVEFQFEGICKGIIVEHERGDKGFGYDSIFIPTGADRTFAQIELQEKNQFSHRKMAINKMIAFLNTETSK